MAETIKPQDFLERTAKAVEAVLHKHKLPAKPQGGTIPDLELMGFVLREADLAGKTMKEVHGIAAEAVRELGGRPAIYIEGGKILLGFVGKPNGSVFKF
ncbi:MAG: hypothetical protein QOH67_2846 [Hyphomicrobiales bacterium]|jgi:hypothetical protein|nr:hypothetical protein [Hyphomicrobiales bacterium]